MKILTLVYGGVGQPTADEVDRLVAADQWPRVRLYEQHTNSDMLDERDILAMRGLRSLVYRAMPIGLAQAAEAFSRRRRYDAIVSWGERFGLPLAAMLKATGARTPHVALFSWISTLRKAA